MKNEMDEWEILCVQKWFKISYEIDLTKQQAIKVQAYELDRDLYSDKYHFSLWEEKDFELVTFKEILNEQQFGIYLTCLEKNIGTSEQSLVEIDKSYINQVAAAEDKLVYYKKILLPAFKKLELNLGFFQQHMSKVNYMKTEYKRYLNNNKKKLLVNHFKHSRTFQPNLLKLALYRHEIECLLPNYESFQTEMDGPTKAVATFLKEKLHRFFLVNEEILNNIFQQLIDFGKVNSAKHIGEIQGWHVTINQNQSKEKSDEIQLMTFVLMDNQLYKN